MENWKAVTLEVVKSRSVESLREKFQGKNVAGTDTYVVRVPENEESNRHKDLVSWCRENGCFFVDSVESTISEIPQVAEQHA